MKTPVDPATRFLNPSIPLVALAAVLVFSGCSSHYRGSLEVYRAEEPLPFQRRTMQWVEQSDRETTPGAGSFAARFARQEAEAVHGSSPGEIAAPQDAFLRAAGEFFQLDPAALATRIHPLEDRAGLDAALADGVAWEELRFAVALRNPGVRVARLRWEATLNQYMQSEYLEGLIGQYRAFTRALTVETGEPLNQEMSRQFFPFPGALGARGEVIRRMARMAEVEWRMALRDAVVDAGEAYFDYQYQARAEGTSRENVALVESLLGLIEQRYRVGGASQSDLLKMQTELERQKNEWRDVQSMRRSAAARMNAFLDRPADAPLGPPGDANLSAPVFALDTLTSEALRARQEVVLQRERVARNAAAVRLGEVMNRPLATQGYSVFERGMDAESSVGESAESFGAMAKTRERPDFARAEAYLVEMGTRVAAERAALGDVEAETRAMAVAMMEELDIARRGVELAEGIVVPQSRSAYETSLGAYTAGRASFIDLLDAERALLAARLEQHEMWRALNQTVVRLATVTGTMAPTPTEP